MRLPTRYYSKLIHAGWHILVIGLCLGMGELAQAAGYSEQPGAQTLYSTSQYTANTAPTITCGKQPGQPSNTLNIRGADITTLWRSAYHMIFPATSLADNTNINRAAAIPHKGLEWGLRVSHGSTLVNLQTKW